MSSPGNPMNPTVVDILLICLQRWIQRGWGGCTSSPFEFWKIKKYWKKAKTDSILFGGFFVCLRAYIKATNFDLCSALMAIEQWGFFSMPHILWPVNNGHLRGHSHIFQSVLHEAAFTWFNDLGLSRVGFEHPSLRLPGEHSNRLRHRRANRRYITNNSLIFVCIHIYVAWIFLINMQCFKNFSPQLSFFPIPPSPIEKFLDPRLDHLRFW